jgi:DNA processing protein
VDPILCLQLLRSRRVGPATWHRLVAEHGLEGALQALPQIAAESGVTGYEICPIGVVRAEMAAGAKIGARLVVHGQPDYPVGLMDLADAPPVLWAQGDLGLVEAPGVAIVGSRDASSLGRRMAKKLAEGLGSGGKVVISGLARGIDTAAHEAALATGTVAVVAGGVDHVYPPENGELMARIAAEGLILSEQPPGTEPQTRHFPMRNRIISGLSRAVVVVEAATRSGSLVTAEAALEQGREVLAVPGHPFDPRSAGCNDLLRQGAVLTRGAGDVFAALGEEPKAPRTRRRPPEPVAESVAEPVSKLRRPLVEVARLHSLILSRLGPAPLPEDQLIRDLAMAPAMVSSELVTLELEGKIERGAGGMLSRG